MVIRRLLRDVSSQLRHLHVRRQVLLQTSVYDLALRRFQTVHHVGNRTLDVLCAKVCQVAVHKVRDGKGLDVPIWNSRGRGRHVIRQPSLAVVSLRFGEGQGHGFIHVRVRTESHCKLPNLLKVLFGFGRRGCAKTLVVLHGSSRRELAGLLCSPELLLRKVPHLARLDDGCDHRHDEPEFDKLRPIHMEHV